LSDYRVKVTVRNARLMRAFESIGHSPSGFAKAYGFNATHVCALAALKIKPVGARGMWHPFVMKLCELTNLMPDELFTERQMEGLRASTTVREVDEEAIEALMAPTTDPEALAITSNLADIANEVIDTLSPRSAHALRLWAGGATFQEIGDEIGPVGKQRALQIVEKARLKVMTQMSRRRATP
jgi:hypothetical protein